MEDQKIENLLNVSLGVSEGTREKSVALNTGYNREEKTWELIVKYNGNLTELEAKYRNLTVTELLNEYAVVTIPESEVKQFAAEDQVEFVEKPKRLYFELFSSKSYSCINPVQQGVDNPYNLFGTGVIVAVIDTGIDIVEDTFRNADGTTRIMEIWDQTLPPTEENPAPYNFRIGATFTRDQINAALETGDRSRINELVPSVDAQRHGTSVAHIACGNSGVAPRADIIVVKMGLAGEDSFPRTTQLMMAVDFVIRRASDQKIPVSINLSFGNNYGNHTGSSLLETYLDDITNYWKNCICVGSGNESAGATHTSGTLVNNVVQEIEVSIGSYETSVNLQIWKDYWDEFRIELVTPTGRNLGVIQQTQAIQRFVYDKTEVLAYYGEPSPFSMRQEIYFDFIPTRDYINDGVWKIRLVPERILVGRFDMWLPSIAALNAGTGFLRPNSTLTFTIPSTASRVISVGAYNGATNAYASFSGRGYVAQIGGTTIAKPELVAPGVNVLLLANGRQRAVTGTSFATPFVTGAAALLMEWGIVRDNDPFLYGEKVKAYLIDGARKLPGFTEWPNPEVGWGALCVRDSLPD